MNVQSIMTEKIIAVNQMEPVSSAARLMLRHNLGILPVCDDRGKLRGILTDRDIVTRCVAADMAPEDTKIREIMTRGIQTCSTGDDAASALESMSLHQVRRLPVVEEGGKLVGMVSLCDLARNSASSMEAAEALSEISSNIHHR